MTTGIILAVLFLLEFFNFVWKKIKKQPLKKNVQKMHKIVGILTILVAVLHMVLTLNLMKQRPLMMYVLGFIMTFFAIMMLLSYVLRKKMGKKWLQLHRVISVLMFVCLAAHVYLGFSSMATYKNKVASIQMQHTDLANIEDGIYTGEYDVGYIYVKAQVTVKEHQLVQIELLEHRNEHGKKAEVITDEMVKQQTIEVDAITGATNSSKVIMKAVENALIK